MDTNIRNFFVKNYHNQEIQPEFLINREFYRISKKLEENKKTYLKIREKNQISNFSTSNSEKNTENQNEKIPPYCPV